MLAAQSPNSTPVSSTAYLTVTPAQATGMKKTHKDCGIQASQFVQRMKLSQIHPFTGVATDEYEMLTTNFSLVVSISFALFGRVQRDTGNRMAVRGWRLGRPRALQGQPHLG